MFGGSVNAAGLRYGILPCEAVPILSCVLFHAGLMSGIWPAATPGAKLHRALLPAPKRFCPQLIHSGVPETYVWIPETFQFPRIASATFGRLASSGLPLPNGKSYVYPMRKLCGVFSLAT